MRVRELEEIDLNLEMNFGDFEISQFWENGYVIVRNPLSAHQMSALLTLHDSIYSNWERLRLPVGTHKLASQFVLMGSLALALPEQLVFRNITRKILSCDDIFVGCVGAGDAIKAESSDGRPRKQLQWHAAPTRDDGCPFAQVAFRIVFDEHNDQNGGLRLIPGSHRIPRCELDKSLREALIPDHQALEWKDLIFGNMPDQVELFLKPNQMLVWTPNLWHSTGANPKDLLRRAATWILFPSGGRFRDLSTLKWVLGHEIESWSAQKRQFWGL